jgi:hypothetical protein
MGSFLEQPECVIKYKLKRGDNFMTEDTNREYRVSAYVSLDDMLEIQKKAKELDISISKWLGQMIKEYLEEHKNDNNVY